MDGGRTFDGPEFRRRRLNAAISLADLMQRVARDRTIAIPGLQAASADRSYRHVEMAERGSRDISDELAARLCHALTALSGNPVTIDDVSRPADGRVA